MVKLSKRFPRITWWNFPRIFILSHNETFEESSLNHIITKLSFIMKLSSTDKSSLKTVFPARKTFWEERRRGEENWAKTKETEVFQLFFGLWTFHLQATRRWYQICCCHWKIVWPSPAEKRLGDYIMATILIILTFYVWGGEGANGLRNLSIDGFVTFYSGMASLNTSLLSISNPDGNMSLTDGKKLVASTWLAGSHHQHLQTCMTPIIYVAGQTN